jgi:hypothetical protein
MHSGSCTSSSTAQVRPGAAIAAAIHISADVLTEVLRRAGRAVFQPDENGCDPRWHYRRVDGREIWTHGDILILADRRRQRALTVEDDMSRSALFGPKGRLQSIYRYKVRLG